MIVLDTTAAKARLEALLKVKEKTTVDLMLSKSQLGQTINESDLNNNQKLRLKALKEELESRISASKVKLFSLKNSCELLKSNFWPSSQPLIFANEFFPISHLWLNRRYFNGAVSQRKARY